MLCAHFLDKIGGRLQMGIFTITDEAMATWLGHNWPGNVRELENVIERAILASPGTVITAETLQFLTRPQVTLGAFDSMPPTGGNPSTTAHQTTTTSTADTELTAMLVPGPLKAAVKSFEKRFIESALQVSGGHVIRAARLLKIDRTTLWKKARDLQINMHLADD
jgi:arginine utilization regulatory protein